MIRGAESCRIALIPSNSATASVIVSGALSGALSGSVVPSPQPTARAQSPPTRTPHAASIFRLNIIYTCRFECVLPLELPGDPRSGNLALYPHSSPVIRKQQPRGSGHGVER
ncbi:hypothetical protein [Candidatus Palauibacter sp.]|uniref:hypothetical protein n=1 Tax=Candidatus Palauibacter sp. TaxID=3101350 RepID=UPI003AF30FBE